jgi:DNA-binding transcriptional MerR regulator/methylmalonyl-CoA mutase cobalamin-binding subunit
MVARRAVHEAYPVRTVAQMTGLSADLIRAWERRYNVVRPRRGPRGSRLYSAADVRHLRALARAVESGRAVGDVAGLSVGQLEQLAGLGVGAPDTMVAVAHVARSDAAGAALVQRVIEAVQHFDTARTMHELGDCLLALGAARFVREVAAPLLHEVGDRWERGSLAVAHEHFMSGVLRNLLVGLLRSRPNVEVPVVLLATPAGERHEFGLLLVALLLADLGVGVAYLGVDLPAQEIARVAAATHVAVVGLSVVDGDNRERSAAEIIALQRQLNGGAEVWVGGRMASSVNAKLRGARVKLLTTFEQIEAEAKRLCVSARP